MCEDVKELSQEELRAYAEAWSGAEKSYEISLYTASRDGDPAPGRYPSWKEAARHLWHRDPAIRCTATIRMQTDDGQTLEKSFSGTLGELFRQEGPFEPDIE